MIYIVEIESFKPYKYTVPRDDRLVGSVKIMLPPINYRLIDLGVDGLLPGRPGVYAPIKCLSYDVEGIDCDREKFVEMMDELEDKFRELHRLAQKAINEM